MIRTEGAMMMVASTKISDKEELKKILENIRKKMPNVLGAEVTEYKND